MTLALVLANGVLSGAEIAIVALRRTQLDSLAREAHRSALAVAKLRDNPKRFLATLQVGISVAGTTAAVLATHGIAGELAARIAVVPFLAPIADALALTVVIAAISYLLVVVGEIVPKTIALSSPVTYAHLLAPPLYLAARVLAPMVWVASKTAGAISGLFVDDPGQTQTRLSSDDLAHLVDEAARSGSVHPKAGEIAVRALDFGDVVVSSVMVPRTRVIAIADNATPDDIRRVLLEENHAHFPVYDGTLDDITGVLSTNDVLALAWERELIVLHDLLRPPHFIPESMRAADVLRELQRDRIQFAIVVDERGGTAGIVTLKDLLEELVGDLLGRRDRAPEHVRSQRDGSFVVPGNMAVRDANRELPFALPEDEDFATVGGLATVLAGRIPDPGDHFITADGIPIEVVDASPRRVRWVRVGPRLSRPGST